MTLYRGIVLFVLGHSIVLGQACWPATEIDRIAPMFAPWHAVLPEQPFDKPPFVTACRYSSAIVGISLSVTTHPYGSLLPEGRKNEQQSLARLIDKQFQENPNHLSRQELVDARKTMAPRARKLPDGRYLYCDVRPEKGGATMSAESQSPKADKDLLIELENHQPEGSSRPFSVELFFSEYENGFVRVAIAADRLAFGIRP